MLSLKHTVIACVLTITGLSGAGADVPAVVLHFDPAAQDKRQEGKKRTPVRWKDVEIEFEGNKVFTSEQLLKKTRRLIETYNDSDKAFNGDLLEYCLKVDVLNFIRGGGYLEAKIGEPKLQETEKGLKITVPVEEGMMYRLGQIKVEGTKRFSESQLKEMLDLKSGDVADGVAVYQWLADRVMKAYRDNGYIQSDYELMPEFRNAPELAGEGIVDFTVTITEGSAFVIRRIEFKDNERTPDATLRNALLIKEGETFSQKKFEESLMNLNDLDLFERVNEGDAEFRTDEEVAELYIAIRVKEK